MSLSSNSYAHKTKLAAYWTLSAKLLQQVFSLAVTLYVARLLGPKEFGVMAIGMTIIGYFNSLTSFGMTSGIVNRDKIDEEQVNSLFTLNISFSIVLMSICVLFPTELSSILNTPDLAAIIPTLSMIIPLGTFYNLPMALLRREMNFKTHSIIDLCQYLVASSVMLGLALYGSGIWALVYGQLIGLVVSVILLLYFSTWRPQFSSRFASLRGLVDYGFWEMVRYHLNFLSEYASYFIVSRGLNSTALGLYDRATSFAVLPDRIISIQLNSVLFTTFSRVNNERDRLIFAFNKSLLAYAFIVAPIMTAIAFISDKFVMLTLGGEWMVMVTAVQILCVAGFFKMMSRFFRNFNISGKNYKKQSIIETLLVTISVAMCILGVNYGIVGVALGVTFASIISMMFNLFLVAKVFDITVKHMFNAMLPGVIGSILIAITMIAVQVLFETFGTSIIILILQILFGFLIYLIWALLCPFDLVREMVREIIFDIRNVLHLGY